LFSRELNSLIRFSTCFYRQEIIKLDRCFVLLKYTVVAAARSSGRSSRAEDINIENCCVRSGRWGGGRCVSWRLPLSGGMELLCETELLLQGLGHLGGRGAGHAEVDLDRVVDEPLQGGQSTDHDDTGNQTLPHT